jgi:ribonucleoside-diphosphate reductase alpha chain
MRNATVTTIAPTGALHLIADTSEGIEPFFSLAYRRQIAGRTVDVVNEHVLRRLGGCSPGTGFVDDLRRTGSVQGMPLSDDVKELFRTAHEISPEQHVRIQAAFQRHVDNAVSKTVNLPESATVEEVGRIFAFARACGCKGITVYRNRSRSDQVLTGGCAVCRTA